MTGWFSKWKRKNYDETIFFELTDLAEKLSLMIMARRCRSRFVSGCAPFFFFFSNLSVSPPSILIFKIFTQSVPMASSTRWWCGPSVQDPCPFRGYVMTARLWYLCSPFCCTMYWRISTARERLLNTRNASIMNSVLSSSKMDTNTEDRDHTHTHTHTHTRKGEIGQTNQYLRFTIGMKNINLCHCEWPEFLQVVLCARVVPVR